MEETILTLGGADFHGVSEWVTKDMIDYVREQIVAGPVELYGDIISLPYRRKDSWEEMQFQLKGIVDMEADNGETVQHGIFEYIGTAG